MRKMVLTILLATVAIAAVAGTVVKFGGKFAVGTTPVIYNVVDPFATETAGRVKKLTIVNLGSEDVYYWYNVSINTFNELYSEGYALIIPAGMMDAVSEPVVGIGTLVFRTATNSTEIVLRGEANQ